VNEKKKKQKNQTSLENKHEKRTAGILERVIYLPTRQTVVKKASNSEEQLLKMSL